ncbi:MAG: hypothetical protein A3D31_15730 [Candidatus Fluviicola riflensis]|nr:MAG: hypothetical protein CHH17_00665 [Candidatus Fluviicola riflensis]OGS78409.1 MAG: hypothetical protein A3D31_15730 [Candidatus Fluviicola riflensis]OGS85475.1 MAG: hypothetical protein A2724_12665 [Fluviicola sp. RIFCSPHIGHO2_01_FULL_43_53]OGS87516.1 MAG: hypothetical protein A3E30_09085 [Fluviicola sp. RIFCSPHIGHO2_12_FULL_43_24]
MATIEEAIKSKSFENESVKANINLLYTANWLHSRISGHLKPYQLSHEQFNVLRILRGKHPQTMCQKDVLQRMIAPQSNLTTLMRKLSEKELVEMGQSEHDRREYTINITEKGLAVLSEIDMLFREIGPTMNGLTVSESFHLNALLDKFRTD